MEPVKAIRLGFWAPASHPTRPARPSPTSAMVLRCWCGEWREWIYQNDSTREYPLCAAHAQSTMEQQRKFFGTDQEVSM
jgi:hypothetical protein